MKDSVFLAIFVALAMLACTGSLTVSTPPPSPSRLLPTSSLATRATLVPMATPVQTVKPAATTAPPRSVTPPPTTAAQKGFDAGKAYATIKHLAQTIGPRPCGSAKETQTFEWLRDQTKAMGLEPTLKKVSFSGGATYVMRVGDSQPKVVVGAHVDSEPGSPGANDNASGVALVLELARLYAQRKGAAFEFFGCEEEERLGSIYAAQNLPSPQAMLSLDLVGRKQDATQFYAFASSNKLEKSLSDAAGRTRVYFGLNAIELALSDDASYAQKGVPAALVGWQEPSFESVHPLSVQDDCNHAKCDTADRVEQTALKGIGEWIENWVIMQTN